MASSLNSTLLVPSVRAAEGLRVALTKVWIRHWWRAPTMAFFRKIFCQDGTYNNKCLVPLGGAPFLNETSWCWNFFNATNCTQIRNDAQEKVFRWTYLYYTLNGVWGVLLIALVRVVCTFKMCPLQWCMSIYIHIHICQYIYIKNSHDILTQQ